MSSIKFDRVVSFSSEAKAFPASNLIATDKYKKWQTQKVGENKAFVIIKLEKPSVIAGIDVGNEGSAFVEVLASADGKDFTVLLPTSSFMSPMEARNDEQRTRVRMFTKLAESAAGKVWSHIKVVCSQPFNKTRPFGLTFIRIHGPAKTDSPKKQNSSENQTSSSKLARTDNSGEDDKQTERPKTTKRTVVTPKKPLAAPNRGREIESEDEAEGRDEEQAKSPRPSTSRQSLPGSSKKSTPRKPVAQKPDPSKIMEGVIFALSGFQNPLRSQIRGQALSMGAKYMPDWNDRCTHLVCAFANTPKWSQVAATGGKIVTREWIDACEKAGKQVAWRDFKCGKYRDKVLDVVDTHAEESEAEEEEDVDDGDSDYAPGKDDEVMDLSEEREDANDLNESSLREDDSISDKEVDDSEDSPPKNKKPPETKKRADDKNNNQPKKNGKNETKTERRKRPREETPPKIQPKVEPQSQEDEPMDDDGLDSDDVPEWDGGDLARFFDGKTFHISDDVDDEDERDTLTKYIIGHCGELSPSTAKADIVVSWEAEDEGTTSSSMRSPLWVVRCHQENRLVES